MCVFSFIFSAQVRGSQILEAARLHRLGFPESVPLNEFVRRFGLLNDSTMSKEGMSVESILAFNEIDASSYRIGPSQVSPEKTSIHILLKRLVSTQSEQKLYPDFQFVFLCIHKTSLDLISK